MKAVQKGFTLIELIVVIVILGILAATALPKFVDMSSDARKAVLTGIQGSVMSAANIAYAKAAVSGADLTQASGQSVTINSTAIALVYGYPSATAIDLMMQDRAGATFAAGVWTLKTNCTVTYAVPAAAGASPSITLSATSGC